MIPYSEVWYYIAVNKVSALLRGISTKYDGDFHCLNCLPTCRANNKYESHKKVCGNTVFYDVLMLSEDNKLLEFNHYQKHNTMPFLIYPDLGSLIEKIDGCKNNPKKSSLNKVSEQVSSVFWISIMLSIKGPTNK